ncbi:MAG: hypothetical protein WCC84_17720 [Candidatus Cybelea sp.]
MTVFFDNKADVPGLNKGRIEAVVTDHAHSVAIPSQDKWWETVSAKTADDATLFIWKGNSDNDDHWNWDFGPASMNNQSDIHMNKTTNATYATNAYPAIVKVRSDGAC